mmetsp:Transcript_26812/g.45238  ORF Transcript_26812/g.45238 Transcript_26812/m.45238 type:complete len:245 (+) Transcript_26812:124-858(+)
MRLEFIQYVQLIIPPFALIWFFVFLLPPAAFPLRLASQIFSFIFVRDAMIPTRMWSITPDFSLTFIDDIESLFLVSAASLFMAGLIHHANKSNCSVIICRQSVISSLKYGVIASFIIYAPVYIIKNWMQSPVKTIQYDVLLLTGNISLTLCGNLVEEMLFRSYLSNYLATQGVSLKHSAVLQASAFAVFHMYLAYILTSCGAALLVFTLWEGLICARVQQQHGLMAATIAHGLAIFYITINLFR